jgi:hypothetical protein
MIIHPFYFYAITKMTVIERPGKARPKIGSEKSTQDKKTVTRAKNLKPGDKTKSAKKTKRNQHNSSIQWMV